MEGEPDESGKVSHGMCRECFEHYDAQWAGQDLASYLDSFEKPIAVVDGDGRIVYLNKALSGLLNKSREDYQGFRGGEVMECQYARLPDGCGNSEHCATCGIRNAVMHTMSTGQPLVSTQAILNQEAQQLQLKISTRKEGEVVYLQIDDMRVLEEAGLVGETSTA